MKFINGLFYNGKAFDTDFTFYRGRIKSQNDWFVSNSLNTIDKFSILPKMSMSDHTPCSIKIKCHSEITLQFLNDNAECLFDYSYYDRSNRIKPKVLLNKLHINANFIHNLNMIAAQIDDGLSKNTDINELSCEVTHSLYTICKNASKKKLPALRIPRNKLNLSSNHFHNIADANISMYNHLVSENVEIENTIPYLIRWHENERFAYLKEDEEYNIKKNKNWKYVSKSNSREMWKLIDYNEKETELKDNFIEPNVIDSYFRNIFQAHHLENNPTTESIDVEVSAYSVDNNILGRNITRNDLDLAIKQIGRGIGLDGIEKKISTVFPASLRDALARLLHVIFHTLYPDDWRYQILRPEKKKGHTTEKPKLRGVAISPLLPTLYEIILNNRFQSWYVVNPEQAGFRKSQGCIIQIFAIYLLNQLAKSLNESLFIGFIDYEKAFDFTNRCEIINDLMKKQAGSSFTKAISKMYHCTYYVPKISKLTTGDAILSKHGVTQGRNSSANLFSFSISEVPSAIYINDKIKDNVLQLADDASIATTSHVNLSIAFNQLIEMSKNKYMITNIDKTKFVNLSKTPQKFPIKLSETQTIEYAKNDEHLYLGMWITSSDDIVDHIRSNLSHRKFNISKFYSWLAINEETPIKIKLQVYNSCMLASYLYGCECWFKIDAVSDLLLIEERKILKKILQVKSNTPSEIIYIELNRVNIITKIKHMQFKFLKKFKLLKCEDSISRRILESCHHLDIHRYYESLKNDIHQRFMMQIKEQLYASTTTYCTRYVDISDCKYNAFIYDNC